MSPKQRRAIIKARAEKAHNQISGELTEELSAHRCAAIVGDCLRKPTKELSEAFDAAAERALDEIVKPLMEAAATDPALVDAAARALFEWERGNQLTTGDYKDPAVYQALLERLFKALENKYKRVLKRCAAGDHARSRN